MPGLLSERTVKSPRNIKRKLINFALFSTPGLLTEIHLKTHQNSKIIKNKKKNKREKISRIF